MCCVYHRYRYCPYPDWHRAILSALLICLANLHDSHHILLCSFSLKVKESHKDYANFCSVFLKEVI